MTSASIPQHAHPLVRQFYDLARRHKKPIRTIGRRAGVDDSTIGGWRERHGPTVANLEAALNVLGYRLCIVRNE